MARSNKRWIDITVPIRSGMVRWPSDPPVHIKHVKDQSQGDSSTVSRLSMGSHTGTHIDPPKHYLRSGVGVDRMPLETGMGPARVIAIRHPHQITVEEIRPYRIRKGQRILFKTLNSKRRWHRRRFTSDYVHLSTEAAVFLAKRQVRLVGIDALSVGGYHTNGKVVHRALLKAGVWVLEGVDLTSVLKGSYDMVCLPLRISGGDGSPARVLLRPILIH